MFSIRALLSLPVAVSTAVAVGARSDLRDTAETGPAGYYTLQVAAFPDEAGADRFVSSLVRLGEKPVWGRVDLGRRGQWIRIFIGLFPTEAAARRRGRALVSSGAIKEFLVRSASEIRALGRPRTTVRRSGAPMSYETRTITVFPRIATRTAAVTPRNEPAAPLPIAAGVRFTVAPMVDATGLPLPEANWGTLAGVAGSQGEKAKQGCGLWLSGDVAEGLERLRWIVGAENAGIVTADEKGRVDLDVAELARVAGVTRNNRAWASLLISDYVYSNEGLLLLTQLTVGRHRYWLHLGPTAGTLGGEVQVDGSINLDNNFDRRINPYRNGRRKLGRERPPESFDSLIAINPSARWFNLLTKKEVPSGNITFHELAEAHAKIALGLEYLQKGPMPGAHAIALEREVILKFQRPEEESVVTAGSNRVFRSADEIRKFIAELDSRD